VLLDVTTQFTSMLFSMAFWNIGKYHDNHVPAKFSSSKIFEKNLHTYTNDVYALSFCMLHDVGCLHF